MSVKIASLALIATAAAMVAPSPAAAQTVANRHWSEINGEFRTSWPSFDVHALDHEPFRAVLRDIQRFLPVHADAFVGVQQVLGINPNSLFMRLEAYNSAVIASGPYQWGAGMSLTSEPRVDRQGDGSFGASASIWQYLSWAGWTNVWQAGPTPSLSHHEDKSVGFVNQQISFQIPVPGLPPVQVNALFSGLLIGAADVAADAGGVSGRVLVRPSVSVVADGWSGLTGYVVAYLHGTGPDTQLDVSGRAGYIKVSPQNPTQLAACGMVQGNAQLGGIGKAFIWTAATNSRVFDQPGYSYGDGFSREQCVALR